MVQQGGSTCPTRQILLDKYTTFWHNYRAVQIFRQGGCNFPNGQNMSDNVNQSLIFCFSVGFKYMSEPTGCSRMTVKSNLWLD